MIDWNLVSDGILAIEWLAETNSVENSNKKILDLWKEKFHPKYPGARLFNNGVLIMASYLLFIYIKENEYINFDYSNINTSEFEIIKEDNPHKTSKSICRRIRNSISHGRFEIKDNIIFFEDSLKDGTDYINFKIGTVNFGEFISNFINEVYSQKIISTK